MRKWTTDGFNIYCDEVKFAILTPRALDDNMFIVDALNAAEERKNNATVDDWVTDKAEWCQRCFTFHWNEHE